VWLLIQVGNKRKTSFGWTARLLQASLLAGVLLLARAPALSAQISIGINIGPPPPPRVLAVVPASPGPDFVWIGGYWYPDGRHYKWHAGYWTRPPYPGARWIGPRHEGGQYFVGYWDGDRGRLEHDHHWDHEHDRDRDRWHDHDDHDHHDDHDRH
jgi:hypothetical protein